MQHREGDGVRLLVEGGRRGGDDPHLTTLSYAGCASWS